jgi:thiol:disulfide interchange protein DsbD
MIPITVGILQTQSRKSFVHNFSISCAYTTGIATTFALLGLIAATTGQLFGSLLANPFFIIAVVFLLLYLAGSMFGCYELYIPRFLATQQHTTKRGPFLSAFLFGAASGTVASPCLSPGLLLLLTIVATLHSKILGFILLFAFGIGTSLPLLLVGTFSSSLSLLPQAGMWMLEIKKIFGLILVGMCFYFLQTIFPLALLWGIGTLCIVLIGIYLLYEALHYKHTRWYYIKNAAGMFFIASSVLVAAQTFKMAYLHKQAESLHWIHNYNQARELARAQHKKIMLDISAPYCSLCKAIEQKILNDPQVQQQLAAFVPIKIENPTTIDESTQQLLQKLHVMGVPTILLIDPEKETEIKRWGGELYDQSAQSFIDELSKLT